MENDYLGNKVEHHLLFMLIKSNFLRVLCHFFHCFMLPLLHLYNLHTYLGLIKVNIKLVSYFKHVDYFQKKVFFCYSVGQSPNKPTTSTDPFSLQGRKIIIILTFLLLMCIYCRIKSFEKCLHANNNFKKI